MEQWEQASGSIKDEARKQAHGLALAIRDAWPEADWQGRQASEAGHGAALLGALARLGDRAAAAVFIAGRVAAGAYDRADNTALAEVLAELPASQAGNLLGAVIAGNARLKPAACAALLKRCVAETETGTGTGAGADILRPAALALLEALPGAPSQPDDLPPALSWRQEPVSPALVADTLTALESIDPDLAARALARFLSANDRYPLDGILVPAALMLAAGERSLESGNGLRSAALAHLDRRIAEPLAPPVDWRRPSEVRCRCTHCRELARFLHSPSEPSWRLKAAQQVREHVAHSIQASRCDLDCSTEKRRRPYTLVCTKNQASYEGRVRQREKDLADRERLLRT
jgi:hypothetical protein